MPVVRGTVAVVAATGAGDNSRILQRSRSVTSNYRRSVSPGGPRSHALPSGTSVDHDPGLSHRRSVMMPPPPVITYSGASVCCTPTDDQDQSAAGGQNSPTWAGTSPDSPSDAMLGPGGGGYTLQAATPSRSVTVTPLGSFLAINQPPVEFGESMLNIDGSSDCTSAGKPINFTCPICMHFTSDAPDAELSVPAGFGSIPDPEMLDPARCVTSSPFFSVCVEYEAQPSATNDTDGTFHVF